METTFDPWLRALRSALKGGITLSAASRGRRWEQPVIIPGDWTGATMRGEVRVAPDAIGEPIVTFDVTGPVVADGVSTFTLSLSEGTGANSTGILPADNDADGVVNLAADVLITPSGEPEELLFGGVLPVIGRITE